MYIHTGYRANNFERKKGVHFTQQDGYSYADTHLEICVDQHTL